MRITIILICFLFLTKSNVIAQAIDLYDGFEFGKVALPATNPNAFSGVAIEVNNSNRDPAIVGTLGWAINAINASQSNGSFLIHFNFPASTNPIYVDLLANYPTINKRVIIDGNTQPSVINVENQAKIIFRSVEIFGARGNELNINHSSSIIKGISFSNMKLNIHANNCQLLGNVIESSLSVTDADGTIVKGNIIKTAILTRTKNNQIGGTLTTSENNIIFRPLRVIGDTQSYGNNITENTFDMYLTEKPIILEGTSNNSKSKPTIIEFLNDTETLRGTSEPNDKIELYLNDPDNVREDGPRGDNRFKYLGTVLADNLGNWSISNLEFQTGLNIRAIAIDQANNTSEFGSSQLICNISMEEIPSIVKYSHANIPLVGNPAGGVFTGNGVGNSSGQFFFDPSVAGVGVHNITYLYGLQGCNASVSDIIEVECDELTLSIFQLSDQYYSIDKDFPISATPTNGIFSGPGINGNVFNPAQAGIGNHQIIYTFNAGSGCDYSISQNVEVIECPLIDYMIQPNPAFINQPFTITASPHTAGNTYEYEFEPDNPTVTTNAEIAYSFSSAGTYSVNVSATSLNGCVVSSVIVIEVSEVNPLCEITIPTSNIGDIQLDKLTGNYVYQFDEECIEPIDLSCFATQAEPTTLPNVISASATTLNDDWDYSSYYEIEDNSSNEYESGKRGKWRNEGAFVYNIRNTNGNKNYNQGTFDLEVFNWKKPSVNSEFNWINGSSTTKYSPDGEAVEEVNALNIASAVKFGYGNSVPFLTAQNATYGAVLFESFEVIDGNQTEGGFQSGSQIGSSFSNLTQEGHAGSQSVRIVKNQVIFTPLISVEENVPTMLVQAWVKFLTDDLSIGLFDENGIQISEVPWSQKSRSGEWALYSSNLPIGQLKKFRLQLKYAGNQPVPVNSLIDDIRIQPLESEMNCYVYDPESLRLLASFDDQHFGLYYQYNEEGKLIRKIIETERGTRTIQETYYNNYKSE